MALTDITFDLNAWGMVEEIPLGTLGTPTDILFGFDVDNKPAIFELVLVAAPSAGNSETVIITIG